MRAAARFLLLTCLTSWACPIDPAAGDVAPTVPIGAAKVDITPDYPVRLTGYGSRRNESQGVAQKIWVRALAIGGDADEGPAVLLSVENCGMTPEIRAAVAQRLKQTSGVSDSRLVIAVTHTHAAPALTNLLPFIFGADMPADHQQRIDRYTNELIDYIVKAAQAALDARREGRLSWTQGKAGFAVNRRKLHQGSWQGFGEQPDGPVDHSLPILVAKDTHGQVIAVVANYACHCTTLGGGFNKICGDWAGFASDFIEEDCPGAIGLITIGCGADANPTPRGDDLQICKTHGRSLADEVARLLKQDLTAIDPHVQCRLLNIDLPFQTLPTMDEWKEQAKDGGARGYHARQFLKRIENGEKISTTLPYPVATWTFGDDLAMVFLAGEVVVDYAMRLKDEFDADRLWITAYANTVPCYIPSRRILREGGYEADRSMHYYARPTRLAESTEQVIIDTVQKLLPQGFYSKEKQADFPPPQSPEQSLDAIEAPGMRVELVAAEPLIADPVAFDWGPDGRLWVVEMRDYPNGMGWQQEGDPLGEPGGRIKVLTDTDGDGRYDKATVFLEKLAFPTGVKVWRNGILITAAPDIIYAEDTDGDDRADRIETLYTGFGEGNQQHRVNGLRWGLDNWLHVGNGDSGGKIKSIKTGEVVNVSGRDLRIRPDEGLLETTSGPTQFGRCRDDWGNWFGGNNSNPLWHYVLDDHYLRRNPHFAPPSVRKDVPVQPGAAPVFPISRTLSRFNDHDRANRFTSACSPIVYRDELLFRRTGFQPVPSPDGQVENPSYSHSFVCEPVHNLVHREIMSPDGATFTSRRADDEQTSEFLASRDSWFRPVMIRTGPDGALWIADMYRLVIEHPEWIPKDWQSRLDLRAGDDRGRIYRIYSKNYQPRAMPRLDKLDTAGLVAALDSPNGWLRDMAQQMLLWRGDRAANALLEEMVESGKRPLARLHALCTLDGLNQLRPAVLIAALFDEQAGVQRHAVRLCEGKFDMPVENAKSFYGRLRLDPFDEPPIAVGDFLRVLYYKSANQTAPFVQQQLAYTLGQWNDKQASRALAHMATHRQDANLKAAVMSSVAEHNLVEILTYLLTIKRYPDELLHQLFAMAGAQGNKKLIRTAFHVITEPSKRGVYTQWQLAALAGLIDVLLRRQMYLDIDLTDAATKQRVEPLLRQARQFAVDAEMHEPARLNAVRLLGYALWSDDSELLGSLLGPRHSDRLQSAAVGSLQRLGSDAAAHALLRNWRSHSPSLRSQILDVFLSRGRWTEKLLSAIEAGEISAAHIDAGRRQQLLAHKLAELRGRAEMVFGGATHADRQAVVQQYQAALSLAGDVVRGKQVFAKRCAACHRLDEVGHAVGPDLAALTDTSPQALLVAMFDPNRAVEDKFLEYGLVTQQGRVLTGMLAGETSSSITLLGNEGKKTVVLRTEIDELRATGKSLMPEGLEKDVTPQDVADLIAYLRETGTPPKPFPGNRPEVVRGDAGGVLHLLASQARIYGPRLVFEQKYQNLGWWVRQEDRAVWSLDVPHSGDYRVVLNYASHDDTSGNKYLLTAGGQSLRGTVEGTGTWDDYVEKEIGIVQLAAGAAELVFRSDGRIKTALLDLRSIRLEPIHQSQDR